MSTEIESYDEKSPGLTRRHGTRIASVSFAPTAQIEPSTTAHSSGSITSATSSNKSYIRPYFRSRIVAAESIEKPWASAKKSKWPTILPCAGIIIGFCLIGLQMYLGWASVIQNKYCLVMQDEFSGKTLDTSLWNYEVQVGGFGNGEFEMTTNSTENVYIKDGKLILTPTLQDEKLLQADYALLNLTADNSCTSDLWQDCWAATNATNHTIINPIKSGRINTKGRASIKYGRVEVVAKMPAGDWLWPAIWMLPENNTYGPWPASGEIDILESRGNNYTYRYGGNNYISSALHWGPNENFDAWWRTTDRVRIQHSTYTDGFHTFGLEWNEKYLYTYIDTRLRQVLYTRFNEPQWERGRFPTSDAKGDRIVNPWLMTGRDNTPFDTPFYLIINLAVGGTNGYFEDPDRNKPWSNNFVNASSYFWAARDQWYPTWQKGKASLEIDSVRMWQQCNR